MSKEIDGTSGLGNGAYFEPTNVDNGVKFSALVTAFMERMAIHTHSGDNSLSATLPSQSIETTALTSVDFTAVAGKGIFNTNITLQVLSSITSNLGWYYNLNAGDDTPSNWLQFYPDVEPDVTGKVMTLTVNRDDIRQIRVIGL